MFSFNEMFSLLPVFSGGVDEDFITFVEKFNEVTDAMYTQNDQKALLLPLRLENYAHSTFKNLPLHIQSNYDRAIAQLSTKFAHPSHYTFGQLMHRVQNTKESLTEYAHALRTLGKNAILSTM